MQSPYHNDRGKALIELTGIRLNRIFNQCYNTCPLYAMAAVHAAIGGIYDVAPHYLQLKERGVVWSDWTATNTGLTVFSCSSSHSQIFSIHFYINNNFICSCESVGYQPTIITVPIKQGDVIKINAPDDPNWFKTYIAISECLFY